MTEACRKNNKILIFKINKAILNPFECYEMMGTISIGGTESFDLMPYPYTMPDTLSPQMRQEIKDIINEVLDERLKHK